MATRFTVPAQYAPFIEDAIRKALDEVKFDAFFRAESDAALRRFAYVPDALRDECAQGEAIVTVAVESTPAARAA